MGIRSLFSRRKRDAELDEEIEAHLAMAVRERIERGEDPGEAALAARREFGSRGLVQETTRRVWGWQRLVDFLQGLRYALRGLRRNPGFAAVSILSLALGIGANTAIFSLLYTVMLRAMPIAHPETLVQLLEQYPGEPRGSYWSWASYEYIRDHNHVFAVLTGVSRDQHAGLQTASRAFEYGKAEYVVGNYFSVLGVHAALGRVIAPSDAPNTTAVLGWTYWQRRFHGSPDVLGKQITVNDVPATIVGIAPRAFTGMSQGLDTDVWLPRGAVSPHSIALLARLKSGVTIEQARAEMRVLHRFTIEERTSQSKDPLLRQLKSDLQPAGNGFASARDRFGDSLTALMGAVALLLLLACVNVAGMLLARMAARQHEMAIRAGLGASRGRLMRQALAETSLIAALATLSGIALSYIAIRLLVGIVASARAFERLNLRIEPDPAMLWFTVALTVVTALLSGLLPAFQVRRAEPANALSDRGSIGEDRLRRLVSRGLVITQVSLSLLLLSTAALFIGHLSALRNTGLGFDRHHLLLIELNTPRAKLSRERLSALSHELLNRIEAIPGVVSAAVCAASPVQGAGASRLISAEGFAERAEDRRYTSLNWVGPGYFATLGTPLLFGRDFADADQNRSRVTIINESLARYYFAGRNPIGEHITIDGQREPYEIIGVAGDAKYTEVREAPPRTMYLDMFQVGEEFGQYAIRMRTDSPALVADIRRTVSDVMRNIPVERVITMSEQIDGSIVPERLIATVSGLFGILGVVLAGLGLYGLLAYTVVRRTNEIGIRIALGATSGTVTRMVVREALILALAGLAAGVAPAFWCRKLAAFALPGVTTDSAWPLLFGAVAIIAVAIVAASVPAWRAARTDPMAALRRE